MKTQPLDAVTGAFGHTGRAIAERLLWSGHRVRTLTNHPSTTDRLADRLEVAPLDFGTPLGLAANLSGVDTLYNTYWVRFERGSVTFDRAVEASRMLFEAARAAGIRRVVHVSIVNADEQSPLPYFRGKGRVERALLESGLEAAIVRPTVICGERDILIHNIAWLLAHVPVFGISGDGRYPIQPVIVEDVARIAVEAATAPAGTIVDAVGPETFAFADLVRLIRAEIHARARIVSMPGWALLAGSALLGRVVADVVLTPDELRGLEAGLLVSQHSPTGRIRLSDWVHDHRHDLGRRYANELRRHFVG
jgi:uncharacterized protein YbjT (DUF2867 family)